MIAILFLFPVKLYRVVVVSMGYLRRRFPERNNIEFLRHGTVYDYKVFSNETVVA